jgi:hypothetical protein
MKVVHDLLGHASLAFTADTYATVLPEVAHAAADATARRLLSALAPYATPSGRRARGLSTTACHQPRPPLVTGHPTVVRNTRVATCQRGMSSGSRVLVVCSDAALRLASYGSDGMSLCRRVGRDSIKLP